MTAMPTATTYPYASGACLGAPRRYREGAAIP